MKMKTTNRGKREKERKKEREEKVIGFFCALIFFVDAL
jgi:hypothetical protein